ncbi:hypothetical protein NEOLEDRAFT_1173909 [Neolentinus lepideus HHB14362 ss-1]|uniref:DH domain-containing protein n=1 Tax=Neolentinus lepideus HHB14362 ss-1 TaxID=1314782 RepID=A0A165W0S4_9AGAM|nr:hypothetical protein NEOLEDRAFT_1173909 [Neolentinus lepideus HHB14362 ss-1]
MNAPSVDAFKPLPSPARDEKLPPVPPEITDLPLPSPPPKILQNNGDLDPAEFQGRQGLRPPPIATPAYGDTSLGPGSSQLPLTPVSPSGSVSSAPSSPGGEGKSKKANPLVDLIETEKLYVDQLTGVIRKVASAWSRNNLPPPELDGMFRSIEAVYKANRSLLSKLKDIGTNPSSPKALGDLLMRWIDDLESPYTSYCNTYYSGLDSWDPVRTNSRLPIVLATFSASVPPPLPPHSPEHPSSPPLWTLDQLFLLPKGRLKYYKRLYGRLLKSTVAGRSDHKLLVGAVERLDKLVSVVEERAEMTPAGSSGPRESAIGEVPEVRRGRGRESHVEAGEDEVVIDMRAQLRTDSAQFSDARGSTSGSSSARGSTFSGGERLSRETASTSIGRESTSTLSTPITDLERRLATDRVLDIFTMKPKQVRLQISPPALTYARELRFSGDVVITFIPRATGVEVVHPQGHIFLLTDLFLICERIAPEERASLDGADMWLCYPPLAGKHLRVAEVGESDTDVQVTILRKEVVILRTESVYARDKLVADMKECIDFASSAAPLSKSLPPPMPPLPSSLSPVGSSGSSAFSRSPSAPLPSERITSPPASIHEQIRSPSPSQQSIQSLNRSMTNMSVTSPDGNGPPFAFQSFSPGQVMPPSRSASIASNGSFGAGPSRGPESASGLPGNSRGISPGQVMGPGQIVGSGPGPGPGQIMGPGHVMRPGPGPSQMISPEMQGPHRPYPPNGPMLMGHQPFLPPQQFPQGQMPPRGPPGPYGSPQRSPSDPYSPGGPGQLRKVASTPNMPPQFDPRGLPPVPPLPGGPPGADFGPRSDSLPVLHAPQARPLLPSALNARAASVAMSGPASFREPSPPPSPVEEEAPKGPVTSSITAQMKCKVFLQQHHAQWKSLGSAKLKLYTQQPTNMKQLVVEAEDKRKTVLISTIVLNDGVERVGKTGVAVELSDKGARTGIIYMIQLRNETSAQGLFDSLLAGSDRAAGRGG